MAGPAFKLQNTSATLQLYNFNMSGIIFISFKIFPHDIDTSCFIGDMVEMVICNFEWVEPVLLFSKYYYILYSYYILYTIFYYILYYIIFNIVEMVDVL